MRRLLRIPDQRPVATDAAAQRLFSTSILISATRCLLSYIVFPFAGLASGSLAPGIGIPVALVALWFDARGIRRFWLADHKYRWAITWLYVAVMILVTILLVQNIVQLA
jgi:hypothetical protein